MGDHYYGDEGSWPPIHFRKAKPKSSETFDGEAFWIIWNPKSYKPPTHKFKSQAAAERCAEDMALKYGEPFYVCRAESCFAQTSAPVKKATLG